MNKPISKYATCIEKLIGKHATEIALNSPCKRQAHHQCRHSYQHR